MKTLNFPGSCAAKKGHGFYSYKPLCQPRNRGGRHRTLYCCAWVNIYEFLDFMCVKHLCDSL